MISLQSLKLLQAILHQQQLSVSADDGEIQAVLTAKRELGAAIEVAEAEAPSSE